MPPNPPTSDSEKDKAIPGSFLKLLTTTAEKNRKFCNRVASGLKFHFLNDNPKLNAFFFNFKSQSGSINQAISCISNIVPAFVSSDFVVCAYEDGAVQKFTSAQISTKYFRPRFSKLETYYGIEELQQGLQVRCFWNSRFPHSKASIIGVGSAAAMDILYEKATFESGREDHTAVIHLLSNE